MTRARESLRPRSSDKFCFALARIKASVIISITIIMISIVISNMIGIIHIIIIIIFVFQL